jgi:hypothetical protein
MRDGIGGNSHVPLVVPFHLSVSRFAILSAQCSARCDALIFREAYCKPWNDHAGEYARQA